MSELTPEYLEFKKQVQRKRKALAKLHKELDDLLVECPHEEIESKEKYFESGYDYNARTHYWNECKLCHKCSETIVKEYPRYY